MTDVTPVHWFFPRRPFSGFANGFEALITIEGWHPWRPYAWAANAVRQNHCPAPMAAVIGLEYLRQSNGNRPAWNESWSDVCKLAGVKIEDLLHTPFLNALPFWNVRQREACLGISALTESYLNALASSSNHFRRADFNSESTPATIISLG